MTVLRIHKKQQNFLILDKTCLNDRQLSWGAKGLHAYLMSLPDDWRVQVSDLQERAKNGRDAVRNLLKELEQALYIKKSMCRNEINGRFGGFEFLVLEVPELKNDSENPEPEKASPVKISTPNPASEDPSLDYPATEKATLISIEYNNYPENKIINKTAAAEGTNHVPKDVQPAKKAAAAFSQSETAVTTHPIAFTKPEEALIGMELTTHQSERIEAVVVALNPSEPEKLIREISFCLLNPKSFTACGQDFARKLNAIRSVIKRGEWCTPAELILQEEQVKDNRKEELLRALQGAMAEKNHFEKMLPKLGEQMRGNFLNIIDNAQKNIAALELELGKEVFLKQKAG